jgi:microcystin-dependent protein
MADPFVAEIRIFPFNFAPKGWAFCDGQLLPISQNTALFSLLGTTYGGDGIGGSETVTLLTSEMPAHAHFVGRAKAGDGDSVTPVASVWAQSAFGRGTLALYHEAPANAKVNQLLSLAPTGGSLPHNNMQPYLTLNFCIALQGVFPARP